MIANAGKVAAQENAMQRDTVKATVLTANCVFKFAQPVSTFAKACSTPVLTVVYVLMPVTRLWTSSTTNLI